MNESRKSLLYTETRKVLVNGVAERLRQIIREGCQEQEAIIEALEMTPNHMYLLVSIDPQFGIHRLVRLLKGRLSQLS
jgi:REP-associated tyrosine transposase